MRNISELLYYTGNKVVNNNLAEDTKTIDVIEDVLPTKDKYKINILALGDVGSTLLTGLVLRGDKVVEEIGIWDLSPELKKRLEIEMNQISSDNHHFPKVRAIDEDELFDCDLFLFCASASIPKDVPNGFDVRLSQLDKNKSIVKIYAEKALKVNYKGIFAIVSDPVDPLCKTAELVGVEKSQIKGFGLGVMMARARYYAKLHDEFETFIENGRAFGPHGKNLVIANDINNYNDEISRKLTNLTIDANMKVRELGFKPFIAPAISSGALTIIDYLEGNWSYSSFAFGDIYLGIKNRRQNGKVQIENLNISEKLFERLKISIDNLREIEINHLKN